MKENPIETLKRVKKELGGVNDRYKDILREMLEAYGGIEGIKGTALLQAAKDYILELKENTNILKRVNKELKSVNDSYKNLEEMFKIDEGLKK